MRWVDLPQESLIKINEELEKLKSWDIGTYEHCVRVSQMTRELAELMQFDSYYILVSQIAGLLHDVGKRLTPKNILLKPAKLDDHEYKIMKDHPQTSAKLIEPLILQHSFFKDVHVAVLHHHERFDGKGYPACLNGEQIPIIARMILIVDTVDAMTQTRAYRKGLPIEVAYSELEKFSGTQFDGEIVDIYLEAKGYKKSVRKVG